MAQLRLGYPEIQKHDADVLQITHNTVDEATRYAKFHRFEFPYLCDPDRAVHERYGLGLEPGSALAVVHSVVAATADRVLHGERTGSPIPFGRRYHGKDSPQGVFVVDRRGIVRAVHRLAPNAGIPTAATLVKELAGID